MRLAYLTTAYPEVSHTFIRREIEELQRRGHDILRISIRRPTQTLVDPADLAEREHTCYCLAQPILTMALRTLAAAFTRPGRMLGALRMVIAMGRKSDRGISRHIMYLIEAATLLPILKRRRVRHVHVHFGTNSAAVGRLIKQLGGPPYSMTVHGPVVFDMAIAFALGAKIEDAAFVVPISSYNGAQLRRYVGYEHWSKFHEVHCTVEPAFFDAARPIEETCNTLVCVGRLNEQKGQLLLVDAMAQLVYDHPQARLVLVGDGEMRSVIEQRITAHGLDQYITITGYATGEQVRAAMLDSRALVLPSFAEGLPVVIMEALAMTRPVISTYIAGIPELVRPNENGWLVPAGNVDELVIAMRDVMATPILRLNEMGRAGAQRARERHSVNTEVDKMERLLQNAAVATTD
ncbi:MAG: colanic acid biosynthesis glycosyltransferase WcaL [Planctomycetaceae bacterium]|nr:colanic acid biosynthesis glycosyltransferase WcaL [Planctomycetaceae bacterium]